MLWLRVQILILCCTSLSVDAQTYIARMEQFGIHEGLSNQHVTSLVQDSSGILWIGTKDGLNRFDGFTFTEFNTHNSGLRSGSILFMHLAPDGHLYVYSSSAQAPMKIEDVQYLDLTTLTFHDVDTSLQRFLNGVYGAKVYYWNGSLFIWPGHSKSANSFTQYVFADKSSVERNSPEQYTWGTPFLQYIVDGAGDEPRFMDLFHPEVSFGADESNDLHIKAYQAIFEKDQKRALNPNGFLPDSLRDIVWNYAGRSLIGVGSGGQYVAFSDGTTSLEFPRQITDVTGDERLIVGTESGFYVISLEQTRFRNYFAGTAEGGVVDQPESRDILVLRDTMYTCLTDGIYITPLSDAGNVEKLLTLHRPRVILQLSPDELLIGGAGIFKFRLSDRKLESIIASSDTLSSVWGVSFINDSVYSSINLGLFHAHLPVDGEQIVVHDYCKLISNGQSLAYQFFPFDERTLLIVSNAGLFFSSPDLTNLRQIAFEYQDGKPAEFLRFTNVLKDQSGKFWVTSLDGGLVKFELKDSTALILDQLSRDDGVPTNTFYAVYSDGLGSFWCSTDLGIVQLDTSEWSFQFYSEVDGMKNKEFNRLSHFQDGTGDIYFGGLAGVTAFSPRDFYANKSTPLRLNLLHVEQYSQWENRVVNTTQDYLNSNTIILQPNDNFFTLEVGLNDLFQTSQHQYQYRLADLDAQWVGFQGNRLRMHGLSYGRHVLEIRGKNARGVSAENMLNIQVLVKRPIYMRWWFVLIMALGFFLVIREYWASRTRRMRSQAEALENLVAERTAKIAEQASSLQQMQEARSRFFANISHELRTPLTLIKGPLVRLANTTENREAILDAYSAMMLNNAELLNERIDDLLTLSQADAGQLKLRNTSFDLNAFLERLIDNIRGLAEADEIKIVLQNDMPASCIVRADRKKVEHILLNYLTNAIKHSGQKTSILLKCYLPDDQLTFSVSDNGHGIAPEEVSKIFDRFYQIGKATGVGLGLALSRELADVMQGSVWVESQPGNGSTFYLSIPFTQADEEDSIQDAPAAIPALPVEVNVNLLRSDGQMHAAHILCVEDNPAMQTFLVNELAQYNIETCSNGVEALQLLERKYPASSLPDCILSDIMMPEMDGFELLRRLKETDKFNTIPMIMLTARAGVEDKLEALRIGVDDYIAKPFNSDELRTRIENLIGRKPLKQEPEPDASEPVVVDNAWLRKVESIIKKRLAESDLTMEAIALDLHLSRSQFFRRIKTHTGLTPNMYLREVRLFKARELVERGEVSSVKELSASVGFESPAYFSQLYLERFGYRPSEKL